MIKSALWRPRARRAGLITVGILMAAMVGLSFVQLWVLYSVDKLPAYGAAQPNANGLPNPDEHGAFLVLNEPHNPKYPSNLLELLATTDPAVVDSASGAHLLPSELRSVLVQSTVVGEAAEYRLYLGKDLLKISAIRQAGGKIMIIEPQDGLWQAGAYQLDIPAEGMFGGRNYFQFFVDAPK